VASSRTILVAGAGIGGLTAALALARQDFRVVIFEQAPELSETGAGLQLSPNASRLLIELGLGDALRANAVVPDALSIRRARSGSEIARMRIGAEMEFRYGAPYWAIHRRDLQTALLDAVASHPDIALQLGRRVQDFVSHRNGITVQIQSGRRISEERGIALIGADGVWSATRRALGVNGTPRFSGRTAWRASVPVDDMPAEFRKAAIHLWLGRNAHLVHYPVRAGTLVNIVAIVNDSWREEGWSAPGKKEELLNRFSRLFWGAKARTVLETPAAWLKWALCDLPPLARWGQGNMTLLGDAAHAMLPFLAQGAAMAIEDALVLADCLAQTHDVQDGLRSYESLRRGRVTRVQSAARETGRIYQWPGLMALARNQVLARMGSDRLRDRYEWLYDWRRR
jgi:salicylate hydroxylase